MKLCSNSSGSLYPKDVADNLGIPLDHRKKALKKIVPIYSRVNRRASLGKARKGSFNMGESCTLRMVQNTARCRISVVPLDFGSNR
jgi:hypothetical protein